MADQNAGKGAGPDERTVLGSQPDDKTVAGSASARRAVESPKKKTLIMTGAAPAPAGQSNITPMQHTPPAHTPHAESSEAPSGSSETTGVHQAAALPKPGTRISHYEIIRELGAGGMGTVYLARDTKLGRRVAIKFLQTNHPELTQRFILEARTTARAQHENIVVIYEVGEYANQPFMVLEYLHGQPLTKLLEGGQKLPPARAVELMVPVVRALVRAHEEGIVHRDLKPDNIFVTDSGTIKVLDFGIAKVLHGDAGPQEIASGEIAVPTDDELTGGGSTELTRQGAIMGTMSYMSPEQWGIGIEIDHRSDIWATGIMLYRMIAGKHPLSPLRGQQLIVTAMLNRPMPRIREAASDCPAGLAQVIDKCLLKHKEHRFDTAKELLRALEPFLPGRYTRELEIDESPYAGLSSFQEADADKFFGRSREIAAMVTRIRQQPLMAVVGSSGVGKSSFVRAGLVPALKQSGETWETMVIRPGRDPLAGLASVITPMVGTSTSVADDAEAHRKLVHRLRTEPGYLGTVLRARARREGLKILLFVDQFEELYTLIPDVEERKAFTACLSGVADDATAPLRVVVSIRSDFLDRVPEDQAFMTELNQGLFFLTAPNREGLRDALVQPAEMAGFHFETPAIVEDMLDHLGNTPGALPLLQFAATKLWEGRDTARKLLSQQSYQALGGIAGALASHADSVLQELPPQSQELVRSIFLRLVTPERTRAIVSVDDMRELGNPREVQTLVDTLVQARLLTVTTGDGGSASSVEIVHESLVHSWPMLRRWLDENQDDAQFLEELRTAAKQWQAKGYDNGLLWRGEVMEEAKRWYKRYQGELPAVQKKFLDAGLSLAARAVRRRRMLLLGTFVVLLGMVAASAVALVVIRSAQKDAEQQAVAAKKAEATAREAQVEAQEAQTTAETKARELATALERERKLEKRTVVLDDKLTEQNAQLLTANAELGDALEEAKESRQRAKEAAARAEREAKRATDAAARARRAEGEAKRLADERAKRIKDLEKRIGEIIDQPLK
jgi:serine/threonine protein kinase